MINNQIRFGAQLKIDLGDYPQTCDSIHSSAHLRKDLELLEKIVPKIGTDKDVIELKHWNNGSDGFTLKLNEDEFRQIYKPSDPQKSMYNAYMHLCSHVFSTINGKLDDTCSNLSKGLESNLNAIKELASKYSEQ